MSTGLKAQGSLSRLSISSVEHDARLARAASTKAIEADIPIPTAADEVMKYVSSLNSDTMRWMNKRRPKNSAALPGHVMPSIALQLRHMFDNFDFDKSGEIDIAELKQAVKFVADACPELAGQSHSAQDTRSITNFFQSMDVDHNGVVDFVEFLAAVTGNHSESDALEIARASRRLQAAFLEFATQLRRQRLASDLSCDNITSEQKVQSLKDLYSINYFVESGLEPEKDLVKYKKQLKEFNGGALQSRKKKEIERAREAACLLKQKCKPDAPRITGAGPKVVTHSKTGMIVSLPKIRSHG